MFTFLKQISKDQKKFLLLCLAFSLLITMDYSCLRPAATSLFVTHFGSKSLPWVWLLALPINFLMVSLFNKLQSRYGSKALSTYFPWIVIGLNLALTLSMGLHKGFCLALFIWKDLYILLMFQQLWSQIHASLGSKVGKSFYSAMYALGAVGSIIGSSLPAVLNLETRYYLLSSLLVYPFIALIQRALHLHKEHVGFDKKSEPKALEGLKQIIGSKQLVTIGLLVAFMQMVSALSEFNFSYHLEHSFSDLASRTKASASIMSFMHILTLGLQVGLSLFSLEKLGVERGHKTIPILICFTSLFYLVMPGFKTASMTYVGCKSLDFSLFSVLKESLYAPLDKAFKYEAKSFIDIFVYRGSRTLMSVGLIAFSFMHSSIFFGMLLLLMALLWFLIAKARLKLPQVL